MLLSIDLLPDATVAVLYASNAMHMRKEVASGATAWSVKREGGKWATMAFGSGRVGRRSQR